MMGEADWNNNVDWMAQESMTDASMEVPAMDMDMPAMPAMDLNMPAMPEVELPDFAPVDQLPSETTMLGPDLSGLNFNELDSKTFNLYNNQWV